MLLSDREIKQLAIEYGMIDPFEPNLIRQADGRSILSWGSSSYGYDIRLSSKDFRVFRHIPGKVVDPKDFNPKHLEPAELQRDEKGEFFILSANSYALGAAIEKLKIPSGITVICIGKSTYCRCGLIVNVSPGESGWEGHLTLEFSNSASSDCRVYVNEGISQLLFLEGKPCATTYADRNGKYQGQSEEVTLARV